MRPAPLLLSLLAAILVQPTSTRAWLIGEITAAQARPPHPLLRLAQRQPGGLPGMSDGDEEARSGPKQVPGGLPGRAKPSEAPVTRSLQRPKAQGQSEGGAEPGQDGKKATPNRKKAPDAPN